MTNSSIESSLDGNPVLSKVVRGAHAPVELVAQLVQDPDARQDLHLVLVAPHGEEDVLLRYAEARAHHGLQSVLPDGILLRSVEKQ